MKASKAGDVAKHSWDEAPHMGASGGVTAPEGFAHSSAVCPRAKTDLGTLRRADLGLGGDLSWRDFSRAIGAHQRGEGARRRGTLGARSAPRSEDGLICGGALKVKGPETRELLTLLPDLRRGGVLRGRDRRDRALARSPSPCRRGSGERSRLRSASPLRRPLLLLRAR